MSEVMNTEKKFRGGIIRKEIRLWSRSDWGTSDYAIVGLVVNTQTETIEVHNLLGAMPWANELFWTLLADRDIRRLIKRYQENGETEKYYRIWSTTGSSGRKDVFKTEATEIGGFITTKTWKLCHISGYGRLNEGFGDRKSRMKIGDFVELVTYLGLTESMSVKALKRKAGWPKYICRRLVSELNSYTREVPKLL